MVPARDRCCVDSASATTRSPARNVMAAPSTRCASEATPETVWSNRSGMTLSQPGAVRSVVRACGARLADRLSEESGFVDYQVMGTGDGTVTSVTDLRGRGAVPSLQRHGGRVRARAPQGLPDRAPRHVRRRGHGESRGRTGSGAGAPLTP